MESEFGEMVIDFEPELNEVNFRRMEVAKLIEWLKTDTAFDPDIRTAMIDNAEKEMAFIVDEMNNQFKDSNN